MTNRGEWDGLLAGLEELLNVCLEPRHDHEPQLHPRHRGGAAAVEPEEGGETGNALKCLISVSASSFYCYECYNHDHVH